MDEDFLSHVRECVGRAVAEVPTLIETGGMEFDDADLAEVCRITSLAFRDVDVIAERHRHHAR